MKPAVAGILGTFAALNLCLASGPTAVGESTPTKITVTVAPSTPDAPRHHPAPPFEGHRASVDLAILLDTSNSMDGLIGQAKQQLWTIVNQFAHAQKHGQTPLLRVALFEYGNTNLPASEGYIRQVVPLTDDLDALSAALFELTTSGGDEYCGQVINEAVTRLDWSHEPNSYKTIFIAGNEPFTQGGVAYQDACKRAIEHGVIVNTIHCGDYSTGVNTHWQDGAALAEGQYLNIDQDQAVVHIDAPQDKIIIELNQKLNATYLWYGQEREELKRNQVEQDANAAKLGRGSLVQRSATKSSSVYRNKDRDLVDLAAESPGEASKVADEELPEAMKEMTDEQRQAYIKAMAEDRAELQSKIQQATAERDRYVAAERARRAETAGDATFGDAIVQAVQAQLRDAGYALESDAPPQPEPDESSETPAPTTQSR